ncbi:MAG TPA: hypothetical protein VH583_01475 [Vicinamibacterales bacterium]|jgi:hypothetical protein
MFRTRIALLAAGAVMVMAANAHAAAHVYVQIGVPIPVAVPAPVVVTAPPPPPPAPVVVAPGPVPYGYVWRPAYYVWGGYGYHVVPAGWVRPPYPHAVWVAPRYVAHAHTHGAAWVGGYWRH